MARPQHLGLASLVTLAAFFLALWQLPQRICALEAADWQSELEPARQLARGTDRLLEDTRGADGFHTGSRRFDGEWLYGSSMMAAMGHGQLAVRDPERSAQHLEAMDRALERMLADPALRAFDTEAWHHDALSDLASDRGHAAYYGYTNLALSLRRRLGSSAYDAMNDAISAALERRYQQSQTRLLHTYPGELYPVDNAAAIASIALHARASGQPPPEVVASLLERMRRHWLDGGGLLHQRIAADGRTPLDDARGSGTALAAYFLSFADMPASSALYLALRRQLAGSVLGFGAIREYPPGHDGRGDIDSGPLVAGYGISATGFALGAARIHRDAATFEHLYATAHLFGAPHGDGEARQFVSGGALGNAILLAMLTALPGGAA